MNIDKALFIPTSNQPALPEQRLLPPPIIRVGATLDVLVSEQHTPKNYSLEYGNTTIRAESEKQLAVGSRQTLRVTGYDSEGRVQTTPVSSRAAEIEATLQDRLINQLKPARLYQALVQSAKDGTLRQSLSQVINALPERKEIIQPGQLKEVFARSGLFYEAGLAQGQLPQSRDIKLILQQAFRQLVNQSQQQPAQTVQPETELAQSYSPSAGRAASSGVPSGQTGAQAGTTLPGASSTGNTQFASATTGLQNATVTEQASPSAPNQSAATTADAKAAGTATTQPSPQPVASEQGSGRAPAGASNSAQANVAQQSFAGRQAAGEYSQIQTTTPPQTQPTNQGQPQPQIPGQASAAPEPSTAGRTPQGATPPVAGQNMSAQQAANAVRTTSAVQTAAQTGTAAEANSALQSATQTDQASVLARPALSNRVDQQYVQQFNFHVKNQPLALNQQVDIADNRLDSPQQLLRALEGHLSRVESQQLAHLQARENNQLMWLFDLPVRNGSDVDLWQFYIRKETRRSAESQANDNHWLITLSVEMPSLGSLAIHIDYADQQTSINFYSESDLVVDMINRRTQDFASHLGKLGVVNSDLSAHVGELPEKYQPNVQASGLNATA